MLGEASPLMQPLQRQFLQLTVCVQCLLNDSHIYNYCKGHSIPRVIMHEKSKVQFLYMNL